VHRAAIILSKLLPASKRSCPLTSGIRGKGTKRALSKRLRLPSLGNCPVADEVRLEAQIVRNIRTKEILKDGKTVASREASEEFCAIDVVWPPQAETTTGIP